jgi:hypothetical protein
MLRRAGGKVKTVDKVKTVKEEGREKNSFAPLYINKKNLKDLVFKVII